MYHHTLSWSDCNLLTYLVIRSKIIIHIFYLSILYALTKHHFTNIIFYFTVIYSRFLPLQSKRDKGLNAFYNTGQTFFWTFVTRIRTYNNSPSRVMAKIMLLLYITISLDFLYGFLFLLSFYQLSYTCTHIFRCPYWVFIKLDKQLQPDFKHYKF